jgi:hypothetical protein
MRAPKFIDFLEQLVAEASRKVIVFADRHPAHEAQVVEQWLEGRKGEIELHWLPRYAPAYNPDEFLNNDLKQELTNEPMPESPSEWQDAIDKILERIAGMSARIRGYFKQAKIDLALC